MSVESTTEGTSDFLAEIVPAPQTTVADWADAGLVYANEWQSPFTNNSFTWDGTNLVFPFAQSDALCAADGVTPLELRPSDLRGEIKLSTAELDYAPTDWVTNYTSDEYLNSQSAAGQPVTVLDSFVTDDTSNVILMYETEFGHPVVMITDVYVNAEGGDDSDRGIRGSGRNCRGLHDLLGKRSIEWRLLSVYVDH